MTRRTQNQTGLQNRLRNRSRTLVSRAAFVFAFGALSVFGVVSCGGGGDAPTQPPAPVVTSVTVSAGTTTLSPPQTLTLNAVVMTDKGLANPQPALNWTTSAPGVATVNGSGVVSAVAPGSVTITAAVGSISGQVALTVVQAGGTVATVVVTLSDPTIQLGGLAQAQASARDANNQLISIGSRPLVWSSLNPSIATIDSHGVITGIGIGTATFRATVTEGSSAIVGTSSALAITTIPNAPLTADVTMPGNTFSPTDIIIKLNGVVRFQFPSDQHNVFWQPAVTGSPADINTTSSTTVSRTFATVGVFPFVCTLHNGMVGTVVVSP